MKKNLSTYLKDIKMMATDFINETNRKGYITETGKIEDWSRQDKQKLTEKISSRIEQIEKDLTKKYDNMHKE